MSDTSPAPLTGAAAIQSYLRTLDASPGVYRMLDARGDVGVVGQDLEFRGQKLRKGDNLVLFYGSANRDEAVFEDPFSFRVDRKPNPHLAFGIGEHFCLGANLARLELRVLFEEILGRYSGVRLAAPVEWARSNRHTGIRHLVVEFTP